MTHEKRDTIARAISHGGAFRLIAALTTNTVRGAIDAQKPETSDATSLFGEVITASVLVRQMMAAKQRVQITLKDPARGSLFADSHPDGMVRGLVQLPGGRPPELGSQTLFQVIRVLENRELQQGLVDTSHDRGLAASLSNYMSSSEQVSTFTDLATIVSDDGAIVRSAGFMLQLLPDAETTELAAVTEHAESLPRLDDWLRQQGELDAQGLVEFVFGGLRWRSLGAADCHFGCNCSRERVVGALGTMGRAEVEDAAAHGEVLEIDCDYCRTHYEIDAAEVLRSFDA